MSQKSSRLQLATNRFSGEVARSLGNINGYFRNAENIMKLPDYRAADLLHFHIVHDKWLSLRDWKKLAHNKPVVWTWHDPYLMTGHCIYPMECNKYKTGCFTCPTISEHFAINRDRSRKNLQEKIAAITSIDPLVIVASNWMREMVDCSLYKDKLRIKTIPFGIAFPTAPTFEQARERLGIPLNHLVCGFRAIHSHFKGTKLILQALENIARNYPSLPLTIIAFQERGICKAFDKTIRVIETGWVEDDEIQLYYSAMDFFLMPSKAEAFGMMAIEAMAAGARPIVAYGTALPELVYAPVQGISIDYNVDALQNAILSGYLHLDRYRASRASCIEFANEFYNVDTFCTELAKTYDEEIQYCAGI
ncbi:MAG: glycosyltransferase [Alphaproteobacteria bacterium]|nr:glycosyltransferase [Alphaproteobacteria bacterium]